MVGCLLEASSYLIIDRKGVDHEDRGGGQELGIVEGGKSYNQNILYDIWECHQSLETVTFINDKFCPKLEF